MKKIIPVIAVISCLLACSKQDVPESNNTVTDKRLLFKIYLDADAATTYPTGDTTWITINLKSWAGHTFEGAQRQVWDTSFTRRRRNTYPTESGAIILERNFSGINDGKEGVYATAIVTAEGSRGYMKGTTNFAILTYQPQGTFHVNF